jgi:hypothetical protein
MALVALSVSSLLGDTTIEVDLPEVSQPEATNTTTTMMTHYGVYGGPVAPEAERVSRNVDFPDGTRPCRHCGRQERTYNRLHTHETRCPLRPLGLLGASLSLPAVCPQRRDGFTQWARANDLEVSHSVETFAGLTFKHMRVVQRREGGEGGEGC